MAGTLFGLGLQQNVDINGNPLSGSLLYVYAASTSTPSVIYQDFGLSVLHTWPLEADSAGRLPPFWLADGSYRARLTTSTGIEVYDYDGVQAIGASSSSGGGGGSSVDANAILQTGDFLWSPVTGTRAGFVRANGRTIGSASSGATERANADVQSLYEYNWANFSDSLCPVTGGRSGAALTDFNANKPMGTLDMRARGAFGLDDMGNSAAGIITGGTTGGAASGGTAPKYHEATWTPALAFGGSATGITYSTQVGRYVRIDDMITAWGTIILSNNGSATGLVTITGLPFAASTVSGLVQCGTVAKVANIASGGSGLLVRIESAASVLDVAVYDGDSGTGSSAYNHTTGFTDTATLSFAITYRTDDTTAGTTGSLPVDYRLGNWLIKL